MEPYYRADDVTIYCADAEAVFDRRLIPEYGLMVTDPPYCTGYRSNDREVLGSFDQIAGDDDPETVLEILRLAWRRLRINRHGYVFGKLTPQDVLPNEVGGTAEIIWNKSAMSGGDLTMPWGTSHETIWFGVKRYYGKRSVGTGQVAARMRRGTVLSVNRSGETGRVHPMQKPVELLSQLIEMSSNHGELVVDPFMGVGSTCIAAILEGRTTIGIEIEEKYCQMAEIRIREALRIRRMIADLR